MLARICISIDWPKFGSCSPYNGEPSNMASSPYRSASCPCRCRHRKSGMLPPSHCVTPSQASFATTALHKAAGNNHLEVVQALLAADADPNIKNVSAPPNMPRERGPGALGAGLTLLRPFQSGSPV